MISVIVPAHNEQSVIARLLTQLASGAGNDDFEIIVVCNGCTDGTAAVAASFVPIVRVVETAVASKTEALNVGDAMATAFPRFYVDADVMITREALRAVAATIDETGVMAAAPGLQLDTSNSSMSVRSYYRYWREIPAIRAGLAGRGVYGLSRTGREKFDRFPDFVSDDGFFASLFQPADAVCVATVASQVRAPRTLRAVVRRRARVHVGNRELRRAGIELAEASGWRRVLAEQPRRIIDLPAFLCVGLLARLSVFVSGLRCDSGGWGRDDSRG